MWSIDDARSPDYRVGWGTADSPLGPVKPATRNFIVLQKHGEAVATAHHSVVNVPGTDRWYVAYHRHAIPDGNGYKRETVLARMEFDADGAIRRWTLSSRRSSRATSVSPSLMARAGRTRRPRALEPPLNTP